MQEMMERGKKKSRQVALNQREEQQVLELQLPQQEECRLVQLLL